MVPSLGLRRRRSMVCREADSSSPRMFLFISIISIHLGSPGFGKFRRKNRSLSKEGRLAIEYVMNIV